MAASSQSLFLLTLSMVLLPISLAQAPMMAPMMAPTGSMSMPPSMSTGGSPPAMSPMPMMTPSPMMPMSPPVSPMGPPTKGPVPSPIPVPDLPLSPPSPPPGMEFAPSPGAMPPAMASPDSGAFSVGNDVVVISFVAGIVAHLLLV